MPLPDELGFGLKAYFNQNYNAGTGVYIDDVGNAADFALLEGFGGTAPGADTSTAPSGRLLLSFNGSNQYISGGQISSGALASYAGSGCWVEFYILKRPSSPDNGDFERVVDYNSDEYLILNFGDLWRAGATGDANIDGGVHRVIVVHNEGTGDVTMYIDGVAQSDTGSAGSEFRTQWTGGKTLGARVIGSEPYEGLLGCIGYIQQTDFDTDDVADLDAAMEEWWTTPEGGEGSTGEIEEDQAVQTDGIAGAVTVETTIAEPQPSHGETLNGTAEQTATEATIVEVQPAQIEQIEQSSRPLSGTTIIVLRPSAAPAPPPIRHARVVEKAPAQVDEAEASIASGWHASRLQAVAGPIAEMVPAQVESLAIEQSPSRLDVARAENIELARRVADLEAENVALRSRLEAAEEVASIPPKPAALSPLVMQTETVPCEMSAQVVRGETYASRRDPRLDAHRRWADERARFRRA